MRTGLGLLSIGAFGVGIALGLCGCQEVAGGTYDPPPACVVEEPCADDPSKTCTMPCKGSSPPIGNNPGSGGAGGGGGGGGGGSLPVDVNGTVAAFVDAELDDTTLYTEPMTISALDVDGKPVTAETTNGSFSLEGAASGVQWLLADDGGAPGGVLSTYSWHVLDGAAAVTAPVVPIDVLEGVGSQIGVAGLASGAAHVVLRVANEAGAALEGVEVLPLGQSPVAYDAGPGFYVTGDGTGALGLAVVLNAQAAGTGTVQVQLTYLGQTYQAPIPIAKDTVTYARLALDTTP